MEKQASSITFTCHENGRGAVICKASNGKEKILTIPNQELAPMGDWTVEALFNAETLKDLGVSWKPGQKLEITDGSEVQQEEQVCIQG